MILDGGLATHLETLGYVLDDSLWSARLLIEAPEIIQQAHLDYLWAGADAIITTSYQATVTSFQQHGLTESESIEKLRLSTQLALAAREEFWRAYKEKKPSNGRLYPLVAASIGPYGAYLADGSEYSGNYGMTSAQLVDWHRKRWHLLAHSGADLLACETIPSFAEAQAYLTLADETPEISCWLSFSCRDGGHIWDGTAVVNLVQALASHPQVIAIGVNCTAPRHIPQLIQTIHAHTNKPVIVYPNSGEQYNFDTKTWIGKSVPAEFGTYAKEWRKLGAAVIGGCCRTTPAHIQQIRDRFSLSAN